MSEERVLVKETGFWCLQNVDFFKQLPLGEQVRMHPFVRSVRYRQGETIYFPGDPSDMIYFLHQGRVRLAYLDESGKRFTLLIVQPGEPFGELALADEERRQMIAEALEDVMLCAIAKNDLLELARNDPHLSLTITKLVGLRLLQIQNKLEDFLFKDVPTRLARLLLKLGREHGSTSAQGTLINLRITHQELADLIGATRETTSATLSHFQSAGWIEKSRDRLVLKDIKNLEQQAGLS